MVQFSNFVVALVATASTAWAVPIDKRASGCSSYIIINTRGTGEFQGQSLGFRTMNSNIQSKRSGGSIYNTVYSAGVSQISTVGTNDIVNKVTTTLASAPDTCFVLEGYSQGAAATTNAMSKLTGTAFDAVKAVFLIGNPLHHAGKACNVDTNGGQTTANVNGMEAALGGIPNDWISKTLDVCNYGDGVCDTTHGFGINAQHLAYPFSGSAQNLGSEFVLKMLDGSGTGASSISSAGSTYASGTDAGSADATSTDSSTSNGGLGGGSPGLSSLGGLSGFHNPFGSISSYFKL